MRKLNGYMTLEASFIVPTVIMVFVVIIYFSNILYTKCIMAQDCYIMAFRASIDDKRGRGNVQDYVYSKQENILGHKYFGGAIPAIRVESVGKKVVVTADITNKTSLLPFGGLKLECTEIAQRRDTAGHIRTIKRIMDIGSKE